MANETLILTALQTIANEKCRVIPSSGFRGFALLHKEKECLQASNNLIEYAHEVQHYFRIDKDKKQQLH